jgi:hypothetical protein
VPIRLEIVGKGPVRAERTCENNSNQRTERVDQRKIRGEKELVRDQLEEKGLVRMMTKKIKETWYENTVQCQSERGGPVMTVKGQIRGERFSQFPLRGERFGKRPLK